jgi:hypothetical protein
MLNRAKTHHLSSPLLHILVLSTPTYSTSGIEVGTETKVGKPKSWPGVVVAMASGGSKEIPNLGLTSRGGWQNQRITCPLPGQSTYSNHQPKLVVAVAETKEVVVVA